MFRILLDGQVLHDPSLGDSDRVVSGATLTEAVNCASKLEFTIYPNNALYGELIITTLSVVEAYDGDELIFRGRPLTGVTEWINQIKVTCESDFAMLNDTIVRPYEFSGSPAQAISALLEQHNAQVPTDKQFTLRRCTVTDPNNYISRSSSEYPTTMAELQDKLIGSLGGYIYVARVNGVNYIDWLAVPEGASTQTIELTKNLLTFSRTNDGSGLITGLIPLGAVDEQTGERITIKSVNDGVDYVQDDDAVDAYGLILGVQTWDDVTLPSNLLTKAQAALQDILAPTFSMELTAADLSQMDADIEAFRFLHFVTVIDEFHQASGVYLISGKTTVFDNPAQNTIRIGKTGKTISSTGAAIKKAVHEVVEISEAWSASAIVRATNLITGATGGHVLIHRDGQTGKPDEVLIMDTESIDTAVKVWRWNMGGLGYSRTGYAGPYILAMTQDGEISADFITTGVLDASVIQAGTIRSQNYIAGQQGFAFDLETGEMQTPGLKVDILNVDGLQDQLGAISGDVGEIADKTSRISVTAQDGLQVFSDTPDTYVQVTGKHVNMVADGQTELTLGNGSVEVTNVLKSPELDLGNWKLYLLNGKLTIVKVG